MKLNWPSERLWLLIYLAAVAVSGVILIVFRLPVEWLAFLLAPIFLSALHYPRRTYIAMVIAILLAALPVVTLVPSGGPASAVRFLAGAALAGITTEAISQLLSMRKRSDAYLQQHDAYLAALHETTLGLINHLDSNDLLTSIVTRAAELVGTQHGFLYLANPEGTRLEVRLGTGMYADYVGYQLKKGEGLSGRVWQTGQAMRVNDYTAWEQRADAFAHAPFRAIAAVPLKTGSQVTGVIGVGRIDREGRFDDTQIEILERFAELATIALDNSRLYQSAQRELSERQQTEALLRHLSTHDALTGLCNRAFFEAEMARLQHSRQFPISIIVADADHLKRINDEHGHAAGDAILRQAADTLRRSMRAEDIIARIGGDEFAAILPQTDWPAVNAIVERLRAALERSRAANADGLSLSIGLATGAPGSSLAQVLREADVRMYENKAARRREELKTAEDGAAGHEELAVEPIYRLPDLIDLRRLQRMADNLYAAGGIPVGIIGVDDTVYVRTGWQDVCTQYHRADPRTCERCIRNSHDINRLLRDATDRPAGEYVQCRCENHLWEVAMPIVVADQHVATLTVGQFFFDDEPVDIELFRRQAAEFGFDEASYLEAVRQVPAYSRERVRMMMDYYADLVHTLTSIGLANLEQRRAEEALLVERSLFMSGPVVVFRWGVGDDRPIEYVSPNVREQFGYTRESLMDAHHGYLSLLHPEDRQTAIVRISQQDREDATAYHQSYRIHHADGSYRWVDDYTTLMRDRAGRVTHYLGYIVDATARRQREEALRQSEATFRVLFEDSPISLWEQDFSGVKRFLDHMRAEGVPDARAYFKSHPEAVAECVSAVRLVRANRASRVLYGAGSGEDMMAGLDQYLTPDSYPCMAEELAGLYEGRTDFEWEGTNRKLNGEWIHIRAQLSVLPGHEDTMDQVIVAIEDITERDRAERNLEHWDRVLVAVAESALELLGSTKLDAAIQNGLKRLGETTGADRVYIFENSTHPATGRLLMSQRYEWVSDGVSAQIGNPDLIGLPYESFRHWETELSHGRPIMGLVHDLPPEERAVLEAQDVVSILAVPIVLGDRFWGFVGFDAVRMARQWSAAEAAVLTAMAASIGSAIERMRTETALRDNYRLAQQRLDRLNTLHQVGLLATAARPPNAMIEEALGCILALPEIEACAVLLLAEDGQVLTPVASAPASAYPDGPGSVPMSSPYVQALAAPGAGMLNGQALAALASSPAERLGSPAGWSATAVSARGAIKGILEIRTRPGHEPGPDWNQFAQSLSMLIGSELDNAGMVATLQRSNLELQAAYEATIRGWSEALELRDKETRGHSERVVSLTMQLAQAFGIAGEALQHVTRGALLHDIGKMGIPDNILLRTGPLSQEDWVIMRQHTVYAYHLLKDITYLKPALDIPYYHHERWDGNGYPRGLKGEHIPLAARIFAVVDTWDALTSDRPYRPAWPVDDARRYLTEQSGKQFDPQVVEIFLRLAPEPAAPALPA